MSYKKNIDECIQTESSSLTGAKPTRASSLLTDLKQAWTGVFLICKTPLKTLHSFTDEVITPRSQSKKERGLILIYSNIESSSLVIYSLVKSESG